MTTRPTPRRRRRRVSLAVQLLTVPVLAVVLLAGVWVAGGAISDAFWVSVALTTVWFVLAGVACAWLAWRVRPLRVPVALTYLVTASVVGVVLAATTLDDRVVDERVAVGAELGRGAFTSGEHATSGTATVVRVPDGRRYLTLTSFSTAAGPDLRVRLVPGDGTDGAADDALDLGALKGNRGDQQYRLPGGAPAGDATVVIWCRAFSALFGAARLEAATGPRALRRPAPPAAAGS